MTWWRSWSVFKAGTSSIVVLRIAFNSTAALFWLHNKGTWIFPTANWIFEYSSAAIWCHHRTPLRVTFLMTEASKFQNIYFISLVFTLCLTLKTNHNKNESNSNFYFQIYCCALFLEVMHTSTDLAACIVVYCGATSQNTSNILIYCIKLHRASVYHRRWAGFFYMMSWSKEIKSNFC